MNALRECVFCKEIDELIFMQFDEITYQIVCWKCFARGPGGATPEIAADKWNTREAK